MTATVAPVESWIDYDAGTVVISQAGQVAHIELAAIDVLAATAANSDSEHAVWDGRRWHRDALTSARDLADTLPRCPARYGRRVCERHVLDVNETHCPTHRKA